MLKPYNIVTFLYFGVASILSTFYFPFLTQDVGLSLTQVSKVIAFGALFSIVSQPLLSHTFAKVRNKKLFMLTYIGMLAVVNIALLFVNQAWIYPFAVLFGGLALPLIGMYEIYIEKISTIKGFTYSKIRKWGSIGFGSIALIGGTLISLAGFTFLHIISLALLAICAWMVYRTFDDIIVLEKQKKLEYKKAFSNKHVIVIFIMSFLGLGSYAGVDFAFSSYLTDLTGNVETANQILGISTGVKVFLEFGTYTLLGIYSTRLDMKKAFIIVFILTGLRFLLFCSGQLPLVVLGDQFHGIAFPLFLVTVFRYLRSLVADDLVPSCYGIVSMLIFGISNLVYPPLFAMIQSYASYEWMYGANFGLSVITIIIGILLLPGKRSKETASLGR